MGKSYAEFTTAAQKAGLMNQFSQEDLNLAKANPEFGFTILGLKQEYAKAPTDQARVLINSRANEARKQAGAYTGGTDGKTTTSMITAPSAYGGTARPQMQNVRNSYATKTYSNPYDPEIRELHDKIRSSSYENFLSSPEYAALRDRYQKQGQDAAANTAAQLSARTGGLDSSYGGQAATAAYLNYLQQLEPAAYDRYQNQLNNDYRLMELLTQLDRESYSRFGDDLDRLQTVYGMYADEDQTDYGRYQDDQNYYQGVAAQAKADAANAEGNLQGQVLEMAANGQMPSAAMVEASGINPEYLDYLYKQYQQRQAAQAAAQAAGGGGSRRSSSLGNGGGGDDDGGVDDEGVVDDEGDGGTTPPPPKPKPTAGGNPDIAATAARPSKGIYNDYNMSAAYYNALQGAQAAYSKNAGLYKSETAQKQQQQRDLYNYLNGLYIKGSITKEEGNRILGMYGINVDDLGL